MTFVQRSLLAAAAAILLGTAAVAGPVRDFENDMRAAYADYRGALFFTNSNKPEEAARAIDGFEQRWDALARDYAAAPPQYADDPHYAATLASVSDIVGVAAGELADGKLAESHETLEAIRDEIGALHERNGVVTFSDRMNAYHAEMEHVLGKDYGGFDADGLGALREDAAVLGYLASDVADHPPADAAEDPGFIAMLEVFELSVLALQDAARSGDSAAAKKAVGGLKKPYSMLFLKFG